MQSFDRTYEELKLIRILHNVNINDMFWSYLWGIETKFRTVAIGLILAFWSYLWGIETSSPSPGLPSFVSFDRTYEELKRYPTVGLVCRRPRFDRTYEELKQCIHAKRVENRGSFDRTYEELKRPLVYLPFPPLVLFWSYLWGIETGNRRCG